MLQSVLDLFNPYKNSLRHYVLILYTGKRSCRDVRYLPKDTASKRELGLRLDVRDLAFKSHALHYRLLTEVFLGLMGMAVLQDRQHIAREKNSWFLSDEGQLLTGLTEVSPSV